MPRSSNPVPQYFTAKNKILVGGLMFYFEVGTSDPKATFSDQAETIQNTHPVVLDSEGRLPNVFFTGAAKQVLEDSDNVQIWERDNVGDKDTPNFNDADLQFFSTTQNMIDTFNKAVVLNDIVETLGFITEGDGGGAQWRFTGVTGQTVSQSPAQLGDALLNDGNGNQWALVGKSINVLQLGAVIGGVTDALAVFSAAGKSGFKSIDVTGGQFLLSAAPETTGGVTWNVDRGVSFVGAGKLEINADKDKILSKGDYRSIESDANFYEGIFGYLEQNSAFTAYGNLGLHGSVFTSWQTVPAAGANIGVSGFAANDLVSTTKGAWALYGTAVRSPSVTGPTFGLELDVANMGNTVLLYPHDMFGPGQTQSLWLGSGGEISETAEGVNLGTVSCAIGILSNDPAGGADFDKGIVFGAKSIAGTDGDTFGTGVAVAMSTRHTIAWYDKNNTKAAELTSTNTTGSNRQRVDFSAFGINFVDLATNKSQFLIENNSTAENKLSIKATNTGSSPEIASSGSDANSGIKLTMKGAGKLELSYGSIAATTPANFSADRILEIKDGSGVSMYIPISLSTW